MFYDNPSLARFRGITKFLSNSSMVLGIILIEYNTAVLGKTLQICLLGVWFILSIGILSWGFWPQSQESRHLSVPGYGRINLKWDSNTPTGDISIVELSLDLVDKDNRSIISRSSTMIRSTSASQHQIANYEAKTVELAEARLELPNLDVKPIGIIGQPFRPGGEVVFYWNIKSYLEGDFQGRVWLYVANKSHPGDSASRYPIAIQPIELHWRDLFGLSGIAARYAGLIGLIVGILYGIVFHIYIRKTPD